MKRFLKCLHSEFLKLYYLKATKIVVGLAVFLQAVLAYIGAKQILAIGLNATPETNQALLETLPPLEYLGFESILIGIMPMVVLGAIYGAGEYQSHSMRTTLLSINKKSYVFSAKTIVLGVASAIIAALAIASTILVTHFALGQAGLNPFVFQKIHCPWGMCLDRTNDGGIYAWFSLQDTYHSLTVFDSANLQCR